MKEFTRASVEELEAIIKEIAEAKTESLESGYKRVQYKSELKKRIVGLRFVLGVNATEMANEIGVAPSSIVKWTAALKTKKHAIGQIHGNTVRYDIATKALIVKRILEGGEKITELAKEYGVSEPAISNWKTRYRELYPEYINLAEGVMIIGKEEKRITGLANIRIIMDQLRSDAEKIRLMIIEMNKLSANTEEEESILNDIESKMGIIEAGTEALNRNKK